MNFSRKETDYFPKLSKSENNIRTIISIGTGSVDIGTPTKLNNVV